jgi:hypothetical protein
VSWLFYPLRGWTFHILSANIRFHPLPLP